MSVLSSIPTIRFTARPDANTDTVLPTGPTKFIVMQFVSGSERKHVLRAGPLCAHDEIFETVYKFEILPHQLQFESIGGARMQADPSAKKLYLWGSSATFGPTDLDRAKQLLQQHLPDYEVVLEQPSRS